MANVGISIDDGKVLLLMSDISFGILYDFYIGSVREVFSFKSFFSFGFSGF